MSVQDLISGMKMQVVLQEAKRLTPSVDRLWCRRDEGTKSTRILACFGEASFAFDFEDRYLVAMFSGPFADDRLRLTPEGARFAAEIADRVSETTGAEVVQ